MELTNTRRRFQKRVEFERRIISLVNSIPNLSEPLYGLSKPAIEHWQIINENRLRAGIASTIVALAKDLMIFCDSSKNTFDIDSRINSAELNRRIDNFKLLIEDLNQ